MVKNKTHNLVLLRQLALFALVGGTGAMVDLSLFWLFTNVAGLHYLSANVASVAAAICWTFAGNALLTFRPADGRARSRAEWLRYAGKFLAVSLCGLALQELLLFVFVEKGVFPDKVWAKIVAIVIVASGNFIGNKLWVFRVGKKS